MAGLTVLTDDLSCSLQLARKALVGADDLIEGIGDFSGQAGLVAGEPDGEIAVTDRLQSAKELAHVEIRYLENFLGGLCNSFGTTTGADRRIHQRTPKNCEKTGPYRRTRWATDK